MNFEFFISCNYYWALKPQSILYCTYVGDGGRGRGGAGLCTSSCKTFHQCHILKYALTQVLSKGEEGNALSDIAKHRTSVLYLTLLS
jgi:hypothetical protein